MRKVIILSILGFSILSFGLATAHVQQSLAADEIVIKGRAQYKDIGSGKFQDVHETKDDPYNLVISRNDAGEYIWTSNGNKKLIKIEESSDLRVEFTIFVNPDGYGQIFIRNEDYITCETDLLAHNYKQYVRKHLDWGLSMYSGFTIPHPYPNPINCK